VPSNAAATAALQLLPCNCSTLLLHAAAAASLLLAATAIAAVAIPATAVPLLPDCCHKLRTTTAVTQALGVWVHQQTK
jgi:hypothetical protein